MSFTFVFACCATSSEDKYGVLTTAHDYNENIVDGTTIPPQRVKAGDMPKKRTKRGNFSMNRKKEYASQN